MTLCGWVVLVYDYIASLFYVHFIEVSNKAGHIELCFNVLNQVIFFNSQNSN